MLTFDFDRLRLGPGLRVLDLGAGTGRHSFEVVRRGAAVVALDLDPKDLGQARDWLAAMAETGEARGAAVAVRGDALSLPFPDASFDVVIVSEVFEHIPDDRAAMREVLRVLRPGGRLATSVPRWWPEKVCWALSEEYHSNPGGHVRVYRASELRSKLEEAGFEHEATAHAHALHSPYWWLKCAVGVRRDRALLPSAYHRLLVWDLVRRPRSTRWLEAALNPLLGKSVVLYLRRPEVSEVAVAA